MARILVIYGTTEGHTEMIAKAIGNALTTRGFVSAFAGEFGSRVAGAAAAVH